VLFSNLFSLSFKYDPFGRRIEKSSSSGTSIYAYDGDNLVEETNGTGAVVARYSQGLNIDEPLAMLRSGTTSYYQADGLGSLTSLSDTSGVLANTYTYDSFGNLVASSGSLVNNFQYTGREFDSETSLYYYRARYYDPGTGRFLSEDPFGFGAGANFYTYGANNVLRYFDPFGTCIIDLYFERTGPNANGPFFHTFIVLINNSGQGNPWPQEFRGGPSTNGDPPPSTIVEAELEDLRIAPDKPTEAVASTELLNDKCSCNPYLSKLGPLVPIIDKRKLEYGWKYNSNSVTSTGIQAMGFPLPKVPPGIFPLPGWGTSLLPMPTTGGKK
jgi:RHS repeat-associated protein